MYQIVNGCYVRSDIPALAFSLAIVIAKMYGAMHFRYSIMNFQSGDSWLPLNI